MMRTLIPLLLVACGPADDDAVDGGFDRDGDGVEAGADCDDHDPFVYPGAMERCNGRDDDCDGVVDGEGAAGASRWFADGDGDGFGTGAARLACDAPDGAWVRAAGDCDDTDPNVRPDAIDTCDGFDTNCNGEVDDAPDQLGYRDDDGDGFGVGSVRQGCLGADIADNADDCDDDDSDAHPDGVEDCSPGDEDCDGFADDLDPDGVEGGTMYYPDVDGDGFGDGERGALRCAPAELLTLDAGDCDDDDDDTYPGAVELCSGKDQDCDGQLPGDDAWYDLDHVLRIPVTLTGLDGRGGLPVTVEVDLIDELLAEAFVPYNVVAIVPTCDVGPTIVPAQFTDGLGDPFAPGPVRTLGDGLGSVHMVLPELAPEDDTLSLTIYMGGSRATPDTPVDASASSLWWGDDLLATFDARRLGRLDDLLSDGVFVASAADDAEQGVRGVGGWLDGDADTVLRANGPVLAAVHVTSDRGAVEGSELWFAYTGVDPLVLNADLSITEDVDVLEVVPLSLRVSSADAAPEQGIEGWAALSGTTGSLGLYWPDPPAGSDVACDAASCAATGQRLGPLPATAGAGDDVLAGDIFAVSVQPGPFDAEPLLRLWPRPLATVDAVEWRP